MLWTGPFVTSERFLQAPSIRSFAGSSSSTHIDGWFPLILCGDRLVRTAVSLPLFSPIQARVMSINPRIHCGLKAGYARRLSLVTGITPIHCGKLPLLLPTWCRVVGHGGRPEPGGRSPEGSCHERQAPSRHAACKQCTLNE